MLRVLTIVAVASFVLCVVCLSGAAALGGRDLAAKGWRFGNYDVNINEANGDVSILPAKGAQGSLTIKGDGGETYVGPWGGPVETREYAWSGAGQIDVGMPADVTYTQGTAPKITVTGPKTALDRFVADGGDLRLRGWSAANTFHGVSIDSEQSGDSRSPRLKLETINGDNRPPRLKIEIVAPGVTRFELSGSETLAIENYNQDRLDLEFSGASKVTAKGSARLVSLDLSGASNADLSGVALQEAEVEMTGATRATIAPKTKADLELSGAARIVLLTNPADLRQDISGAAVVDRTRAPATSTAQAK